MSAITRIEQAVTWYAGLSRDFNDVDRLMEAARKLACLIFQFAGEVGAMNSERIAAEFSRKAEFSRIYRDLVAADPKPSVAAAEKEADGKTMQLRDNEAATESNYHAAKLLLDAANRVHDQMRQQIAALRNELRQETAGTGSQ